MSDYRIIKTRWYHRLWDYFFRAGEPTGFQTGWLACKLYMDGKTGPVERVDHETEKIIEAKFKDHMRCNASQRKKVSKQKRTIPTVMPQTLEHDTGRYTSRGMGRIP
jgi:hypothetical protein